MNLWILAVTIGLILLMCRASRRACESEEIMRRGTGEWPPQDGESAPGWNPVAYAFVWLVGIGLSFFFSSCAYAPTIRPHHEGPAHEKVQPEYAK